MFEIWGRAVYRRRVLALVLALIALAGAAVWGFNEKVLVHGNCCRELVGHKEDAGVLQFIIRGRRIGWIVVLTLENIRSDVRI